MSQYCCELIMSLAHWRSLINLFPILLHLIICQSWWLRERETAKFTGQGRFQQRPEGDDCGEEQKLDLETCRQASMALGPRKFSKRLFQGLYENTGGEGDWVQCNPARTGWKPRGSSPVRGRHTEMIDTNFPLCSGNPVRTWSVFKRKKHKVYLEPRWRND